VRATQLLARHLDLSTELRKAPPRGVTRHDDENVGAPCWAVYDGGIVENWTKKTWFICHGALW
jgi:hypothetical protein